MLWSAPCDTKKQHLCSSYGRLDAVIVGSGPNGLAAAIAIAQTGRKVVVFEGAETLGGGCRSAELTRPGFVHDVCSAVHPFAVVSPFFRSLPLAAHGFEWIRPPVMLAHPIDNGAGACVYESIERTAEAPGRDTAAYRKLFEPLVESWPKIADAVLGPLRWRRHPIALARASGSAPCSRQSVRRTAFFAGESARAVDRDLSG